MEEDGIRTEVISHIQISIGENGRFYVYPLDSYYDTLSHTITYEDFQ